MEKLRRCNPVISKVFHTAQIYRTRTEMEISVLSDIRFPTTDAKYWQTVREMDCFINELIELGFTYREKCLDLKELEQPLGEYATEIDKERRKIAIERKRFEIQKIQRDAHHRIREIDLWRDIQERLIHKGLVGGTDDVENHQLISYTVWFLKQWQTYTDDPKLKIQADELQNLMGHIETSLRVVRERNLMETLKKTVEKDTGLLKFLKRRGVV
jgi:hypothetical protein